MRTLARQLEAGMERLAAASVGRMYEDPFWFARYGEQRARRFGGEDAVFHVRHLVQALDTGDAGIMERYVLWLQNLLVPRGMCSHHIAAHLQGLHTALENEGLTQPPAALDYLRAALNALDWPEGPASAVRAVRPALLEHMLHELLPPDAPREDAPRERLREECVLQLSYLMDALGTQRPGLFVDHVRWYAGFWPQRGLEWSYRRVLEALESALLRYVPDSKLPRVTVAMGLTALEKTPS